MSSTPSASLAVDAADAGGLAGHLVQCSHDRGRLHALRAAAEAVHAAVAPRFVSSIIVLAGLAAGTAWLLG